MAKVNMSQAARLVGKSRTTIHRKINKGELSIQSGLVDTSELIRVFGALVSESEQSSTGVTRSKQVTSEQVTVQQQVQLEVMQVKLEALQRELELEREVKEGLKQQIALLEHNPTTSKKPSPNMSENSESSSVNSEYAIKKQLKEEREKEGRLMKLGRFLFDT